MTETKTGEELPSTRPSVNSSATRWVAAILALGLVFTLGLNIGNGRITLRHAAQTGLPTSLDYSSVNQVYQSLKDNYDGTLNQSQLTDGLKHGLATATKDPYTEYFTAAEAKSFQGQLNNSFSGIGAELGENAQGSLQVISPISGLPADKAGLLAQDVIASINGKSTDGMTVDAAVNAIRGKSGSTVTLQIIRGGTQQLSFTITRQNVQVPSVTSKVLDGNLGYIQIITFADDTPQLIQKAADSLKAANVKGVVLDLRGNPGGLVDSAVAVSSEWLPENTRIMQEKRGSSVQQTYNATGNDELHGIPTVVLIDSGSASASEITAGALHDNQAAYLIGTKSYGKGVVQKIVNFNDGSELKVTVASWYRPDGKNINHLGITPDKAVTVSDQDIKTGNDTQLQAAETYLNK